MNIDIQHIAKLSRLSIPAEKVEKFQRDMENIVAMVEKLPYIKCRPKKGSMKKESLFKDFCDFWA